MPSSCFRPHHRQNRKPDFIFDMKNILVVDNDPITLHILAGMLRSHSNFLNILAAQNIQTALETLDQKKIHVLITGMHISESDAFKLCLLLSDNSETRVIIITDNASPAFCEKTKKLASVIHFNQVLDISLLTKRIFTELQIDFGGQIHGLTLPSLLQLLELERRSCTLLVTAKANSGTIYLTDGKPTAAKTMDLTGISAALHILTWQNVLIDIDNKPKEIDLEITKPLMTLLLESGKVMDEELSLRQNLRQHSRYDCLVGVEFKIDDVNYHCYMRDLSEGGAYLETDQPVELDQQLVLTLFSPMLEQSCAIEGIVVRRDKKGIGVRFEDLILKQKHVIRSLIESCCVPIPKPSE
jgi:CheY-like chemotaxis protein/Tfp pilus assembly protein PilZ